MRRLLDNMAVAVASGVLGGGINYLDLLKSLNQNLVGIWLLNETSGTVAFDHSGHALNGTYTGGSLASTPWPLGGNVVTFAGSGQINLPLAALDPYINWEEYSVILWVKLPLANWENTTSYTFLSIATTGTTQRLQFRKNTIPGELQILADTGTVLLAPANTTINSDWIMIGVTVSKSANECRAYLDGSQFGPVLTGIGTDDGSALVAGAIGVSGLVGALGVCAIYSGAGAILTPAQMLQAYQRVYSSMTGTDQWIVFSGDSTMAAEGVTVGKLITNLGAGYTFKREISLAGLTTALWKAGGGTWLGIDAELAKVTFPRDPAYVVIGIGKNDLASMPTEAAFKTNYGYGMDAIHTKCPSSKVITEIPWRSGQDANATTAKGWIADLRSTRSWSYAGPDETGYFRSAELATPGSYSSDGVHINTDAGTTARAAELQAVIEALA